MDCVLISCSLKRQKVKKEIENRRNKAKCALKKMQDLNKLS